MDILDKIANVRGSGHHVGPELEEILTDLHQRLVTLEPKKVVVTTAGHGGSQTPSIFAPAKLPPDKPLEGQKPSIFAPPKAS